MKVLVLSGEVTHPRPLSYGLSSDWQVSVLSLVDTEHLAICDKYGSPSCVPPVDVITFLKRAYEKAISSLKSNEPDIIIGTGYGAHILSNLNASHEWRGPSVFILTEGNPTKFFFVQKPLIDDLDYDPRPIKTAWVVTDDDASSKHTRPSRGRSASRKSQDSQSADIFIRAHDAQTLSLLFSSGVVGSVVRCLM